MIETVGNRKEATMKTNRERERGLWRRGGRGVRRGLSTAGSLDVWTLFGPISLSEGFARERCSNGCGRSSPARQSRGEQLIRRKKQ